MLSEQDGSYTTLYCALSDDVSDKNGAYFDDCKVKVPSKAGQDKELAKQLWEKSLEWVGLATTK